MPAALLYAPKAISKSCEGKASLHEMKAKCLHAEAVSLKTSSWYGWPLSTCLPMTVSLVHMHIIHQNSKTSSN